MAITSAGDIKGMTEASAAIVATITGVAKVYDRVGELPPDDSPANLPAIIQSAVGPDLPAGRVETLNGHEVVHHYWYLDLLIARAGDIHAEQAVAMPFVPLVFAKFHANFNLGNRLIVERCFPQNYRLVVIDAGDHRFFGVRFLIHCRAKMPADYTDPS